MSQMTKLTIIPIQKQYKFQTRVSVYQIIWIQ